MNYLAYGGGTNSTALAIECVKRGIPIHAIAFADTGGERPETYEYVRLFSAWLVSKGCPAIDTVRIGVTLESDCLRRHALPSVVYGYKTCSQRWKMRPQDKYLDASDQAQAVWAAGGKVTKLIGFDADEPERGKPFSDEKYVARYPLIEWNMGRDECLETIRDAGLPQPGKSSCFFCPNMSLPEIRDLYDIHPELFRRAIEMEKNAHLEGMKGLDRDKAWADYERFFRDQTEMPFLERPKRKCGGCYDG